MSKQKWIIAASLLLLPGILGISIYRAQKHDWEQVYQQACMKASENQVSQEYLRMYEQWSRLAADQKSENPWGQGEYGGPEIQKKLRDGQSDRLTADLPDLEIKISHFPRELTEVVYGQNWQQRLEDYQKDRSQAELLLIGSTFFLACGCIVGAAGITRWTVGVCFTQKNQSKQEECNEPESEPAPECATGDEVGKTNLNETGDENTTGTKTFSADKNNGYFQNRLKDAASPVESNPPAKKSSFLEQFASTSRETSGNAVKDDYFGWAVELEEKPELKTLMTSEPLTKELSDLTEEVSAIRHFAAQQQDQMRKLQDGYDWMIVRRFCLRIIRCVDNLEDRIGRLDKKEQVLSDHLQDVRDELVFALESSGVEQYEPDLNVSYKGLERYAEAVKERVETTDKDKAGCIAEVMRSGYQYLVNDDDVKIVRCAQVKLYEFTQNQ